MSKTSHSVLVKVLDTDGILLEACKAGELELSEDEQRKVCFFLEKLIEKLWKKFEIEDVDIQFLLAKKVDFDIRISESHLEEFHKRDKLVLQHFHSFKLKVNDIRSYINLEQKSPVKWKLLNYLEKEYTDEEKKEWGRPLKEYHNPAFLHPDEWDALDEYIQTGAPERSDYT
jgi:hypothetical protein